MTDFTLTDSEKKKLLSIARETVEESASGKKKLKRSKKAKDIDVTEKNLNVKAGAFVSLHKKGRLRGCIGRFEADQPLYETVMDMAFSASMNDPRFPEVRGDEVDDIDIEISVLSPLRKIKDISEIEVGRHGIYIIKGYRRGTLLPQVATDHGWDTETFLAQTSRKAGLDEDAWKEGDTEIYIYDAIVFGEGEK